VGWGGFGDFYFGIGGSELFLQALFVEANVSVAIV
jgi:hypothetical protein